MLTERKFSRRIGNRLLFTGPTLIAFIAVIIIPFIYGIYMTFYEWDGISSTMPFAGFDNYKAVMQDEKFWTSIWLTIKYVAASVLLINVLAFALAYLVTTGVRGQNFFRASFFSPNLIGGLVLGFIWQFIFNIFLPSIGETYNWELFTKTWLGDETKAFWALVIVTVWQYMGYMMVIFIAGLMSVPKDVLEAAKIDGTGGLKLVVNMILPLMIPSFIITVFLSLQRSFMVYDVNYALTGGGPFGSTVMASMHVYDKAFQRFDYGVGQAEAIVLFVIVAAITITQVYLTKRMEVEA